MHRSVTIKKQHKSYVVESSPGKNGEEKHTNVAFDMSSVLKLVKAHFDQIIANDLDGAANYFPAGTAKKVS